MKILIDELKAKLPENARHFVDFPEVIFFDEFHDHLEKLDEVEVTEFLMDGTVEVWIEFNFLDNKFFVNNRFGDYWFLVEDPECPEDILMGIANHFRTLLEKQEVPEETAEDEDGWIHPN